MLTFNQDRLNISLGNLSSPCRSAFAVSCAQRLSFSVVPSDAAFRPVCRTLEELWDALCSARDVQVNDFLDTYESLLPLEDQTWRPRDPLIENLIIATTYACRSMCTENVCESTYAALQAYEAADYVAHTIMDISFDGAEVEDQILESLYVQEELCAQHTDLVLLSSGLPFAKSLEKCRQAATSIGSERRFRWVSMIT